MLWGKQGLKRKQEGTGMEEDTERITSLHEDLGDERREGGRAGTVVVITSF